MDYTWIKKWGAFLGSDVAHLTGELERAKKTRAPENAIYYDHAKQRWMTTEDITSSVTREALGLPLLGGHRGEEFGSRSS